MIQGNTVEGRGSLARVFLCAFDRVSFRERVRRVIAGWNAPTGSRERCLADEQLRHLPGLAGAFLAPLLVLLLLLQIASRPEPYRHEGTHIEPIRQEEKLDARQPQPDPLPSLPEARESAFAPEAAMERAALAEFAPLPEMSGPLPSVDAPVRIALGRRIGPVCGLIGQRVGAGREKALKAGKLAELDVPGIDEALKRAVGGFIRNADPSGGFGYATPGATGLTGVGVLCLQLLGAPRAPEALRGLEWLRQERFGWDSMRRPRPLYYAYYTTQAKFHAGGRDEPG